jgi:hypothetical protein
MYFRKKRIYYTGTLLTAINCGFDIFFSPQGYEYWKSIMNKITNNELELLPEPIAIKGDKQKGNEVIDLLLQMGGKNPYKHFGIDENAYYFIDSEGNIYCAVEAPEDCIKLSLSDFINGTTRYSNVPVKHDELYLCDVHQNNK